MVTRLSLRTATHLSAADAERARHACALALVALPAGWALAGAQDVVTRAAILTPAHLAAGVAVGTRRALCKYSGQTTVYMRRINVQVLCKSQIPINDATASTVSAT